MENSVFFNFLHKHWSKCVSVFLVCAVALFCFERFFTKSEEQIQEDFLVGNSVLESFYKGEPLSVEAIKSVEDLLDKHQELHSKYHTMLAMTYLAQRDAAKGLAFMQSSMEHVRADLPEAYQEYATGSVLIAEKKYNEAYEATKNSCEQLQKTAPESVLYALNLLRLVSLSVEVKAKDAALEELLKHPSYQMISSILQEGDLSFDKWYKGNAILD